MAYTGPKKFSKKVGKKTVRYGAKGYSISPGTKKRDSCSSAGQMKKHPKAAKTQIHRDYHEKSGNAQVKNHGESKCQMSEEKILIQRCWYACRSKARKKLKQRLRAKDGKEIDDATCKPGLMPISPTKRRIKAGSGEKMRPK